MKVYTRKDIVAKDVKVGDRVNFVVCGWVTVTKVEIMPYKHIVGLDGVLDTGAKVYTYAGMDRVLPGEELSYACCPDPMVRGGRCDHCGEWLEDMEKEGRL
ncbi:MAG TPA: hypothetical protein VI911_07125 [Patescibacteria group bacterium]|nr:hypothetical protein [Patescibacteria group bacterium]